MKKDQRFLFLAILSIVISGCEDKTFDISNDALLQPHSAQTRSAGDGEYDLLGYGYDADGEFANANSGKSKVINIDKILREAPYMIEKGIIATQYGTLISGESYKEFSKNKSLKIKATASFALFKKSISASFSGDNFESNRFSYASYDLKIQRKRLTLYANESDLFQKFLTENFRNDCKRLSAEQLVTRYGTHVFRDILLGGKLSVIFRSEVSETNKKRVVEAGISASVGKIFNLNIDGSISNSEANKNRNSELKFKTIGGDPSKSIVGNIKPDGTANTVDISSWQSSVSLENSQLIDIGEDGLIPLHQLIPDSKKRNEVKDYIYSKIYMLRRNKDYLLNGTVYLYRSLDPVFIYTLPWVQSFLQTSNGLTQIMVYEIENAHDLEEKKYFPHTRSLFIDNKVSATWCDLGGLDVLAGDFDYNKREKDRPILVKDNSSGEYFIQLDQRKKELRPIFSHETIEVYDFNKDNAKKVNVNEYTIGEVFI